MRMANLASAALLMGSLVLSPQTASAADPPSMLVDPPPAPLDYLEKIQPQRWKFGERIWQGDAPCTNMFCEAAYSDGNVFTIIQKEANCCGSSGYTVKFEASAKGCQAVTYYIGSSRYIDGLTESERSNYVERHLTQAIIYIRKNCNLPPADIPSMAELTRIWSIQ